MRVGEHKSETSRPSLADQSEPLASVPAQSPLGDGRGDEHRGDGRGPGEDAPTKLLKQRSGGVGVQDAGQLAPR